MVKVINLKHCSDWGKPGDVLIDRTTPYGNPFYMKDGTPKERKRVIDLYRQSIINRPEFITEELMFAKRLGCWCVPLPCHGHVIVEEINKRRYEA